MFTHPKTLRNQPSLTKPWLLKINCIKYKNLIKLAAEKNLKNRVMHSNSA